MKKFKIIILSIAKHNTLLMSLVRKIKYVCIRFKYWLNYYHNKVDNRIVFFDSFSGRQFSDSPKAIYLELIKNKKYKNYIFVWNFENPDLFNYLKSDNTILVKRGSIKYYKYLSKAKYWIANCRIEEDIPKKKNQVYIQCWHGTPFKKIGCDIKVKGNNVMNSVKNIKKRYRQDAKRYTYLVSPSKFCTEKFISCFDLEDGGIIKEIGYPRNDYLKKYQKNDINKIKEKLQIPVEKKIILYSPTWRDNQHQTNIGYTYSLNIEFDKLQAELNDEYIILFRNHYLISNKINLEKYCGFVYDVSEYNDINDLYIISDILITDYSSTFFDYANLKRPIIFYMYDLDEYKNISRDFYIELDELPGSIVKTMPELINSIKETKKFKYDKKYNDFNKKYNYLDDGQASKRAVKECIKYENY